MTYIDIVLIGLALSFDAFAVSLTCGIRTERRTVYYILRPAVFFGVFQFAMPIIGFLLTRIFSEYIESYAHWIAFALLSFLGIRMIVSYFKGKKDDDEKSRALTNVNLLILAVATSIDAFAAGVTLALTGADIVPASAVIGAITFIICAAGVFLGRKFGELFGDKAHILGGIILIAIGIKTVL